jgi:superfamily II DNA/RNA helicase
MIAPSSTIQLRTICLVKRDRTQALRVLRYLLEQQQQQQRQQQNDDDNDDDEPEWGRVLVFVSTRYAAKHVSHKLRWVGIVAPELHGKLGQETRSQRVQDFQTTKKQSTVHWQQKQKQNPCLAGGN